MSSISRNYLESFGRFLYKQRRWFIFQFPLSCSTYKYFVNAFQIFCTLCYFTTNPHVHRHYFSICVTQLLLSLKKSIGLGIGRVDTFTDRVSSVSHEQLTSPQFCLSPVPMKTPFSLLFTLTLSWYNTTKWKPPSTHVVVRNIIKDIELQTLK